MRNEFIGFVFQNFNLLARTSALENVELPLIYAKVPPAERHKRARESLERVGLAHRAGHHPSQLSGGQQQRVAIARALVTRPPLILADEPTGNLDSATSTEIMKLLTELQQSGMTIVFVTHEPDIAAYARAQAAAQGWRRHQRTCASNRCWRRRHDFHRRNPAHGRRGRCAGTSCVPS